MASLPPDPADGNQEVIEAESSNRAFFERFFSDDDFRADVTRGFGVAA